MATLNSIAENLAFVFRQQFNYTLRESIKESVIEYRALLIRQDLENNFISPQHYYDSFCVEMELVDSSQCEELESGRTILRSKQLIPKPIRLKSTGSGFSFVGSVDKYKSFFYIRKENASNVDYLPFQKLNQIKYDIIDNRLFIINNKRPCKVLIEGPIQDPRKIDDCTKDFILPDNKEFACPADLLAKIKNLIKKEYFPNLIEDGKEVNIDADGNS